MIPALDRCAALQKSVATTSPGAVVLVGLGTLAVGRLRGRRLF